MFAIVGVRLIEQLKSEKEKKMEKGKKILYQQIGKNGIMLRSVGYIESTVKGVDDKIYHEVARESGHDYEERGNGSVWICEDNICAVLNDPKNCNCNCHNKKR